MRAMRPKIPCSSSARRMVRGDTLKRLRSARIAFGVMKCSTRAVTAMLIFSSKDNFGGRPERGLSSNAPSRSNRVTHRCVVRVDTPTFAATTGTGCSSAASVTIAARPSRLRGDCGEKGGMAAAAGSGSDLDRLRGEWKTSGATLVRSASGRRTGAACAGFKFREKSQTHR